MEKSNKRAASVSESWKNEETKLHRTQHHETIVYKNEKFVGRNGSVAKAFKALNLPFEKHIPFRVRLKDAHRLNKGARHNFEQYSSELIEKPK